MEELIWLGVDVNLKDKEKILFMIVCCCGYLGIVKEFIKNGVDVN